MDMQSVHRRTLLTAATAILCIFASSSPAGGSQGNWMMFTGGGYGPTPDVAIQGAIWDAEATASGYQLFNCRLAGQPLIFPGSNSRWGRNFNAEATLVCTS